MIIELEINGCRVIVSGDNLSVSMTEGAEQVSPAQRKIRSDEQVTGTGMIVLRQWIKAVHGRQNDLADALGITTQAISQWRDVPLDKVVEIERATGIKRQVLRPDLFEGMQA